MAIFIIFGFQISNFKLWSGHILERFCKHLYENGVILAMLNSLSHVFHHILKYTSEYDEKHEIRNLTWPKSLRL